MKGLDMGLEREMQIWGSADLGDTLCLAEQALSLPVSSHEYAGRVEVREVAPKWQTPSAMPLYTQK